jgi:hypothetical protein
MQLTWYTFKISKMNGKTTQQGGRGRERIGKIRVRNGCTKGSHEARLTTSSVLSLYSLQGTPMSRGLQA